MTAIAVANRYFTIVGIATTVFIAALAVGVHDRFWPSTVAVAAAVIYASATTGGSRLGYAAAGAMVALAGWNYYSLHASDGLAAGWLLALGVAMCLAVRFMPGDAVKRSS